MKTRSERQCKLASGCVCKVYFSFEGRGVDLSQIELGVMIDIHTKNQVFPTPQQVLEVKKEIVAVNKRIEDVPDKKKGLQFSDRMQSAFTGALSVMRS